MDIFHLQMYLKMFRDKHLHINISIYANIPIYTDEQFDSLVRETQCVAVRAVIVETADKNEVGVMWMEV